MFQFTVQTKWKVFSHSVQPNHFFILHVETSKLCMKTSESTCEFHTFVVKIGYHSTDQHSFLYIRRIIKFDRLIENAFCDNNSTLKYVWHLRLDFRRLQLLVCLLVCQLTFCITSWQKVTKTCVFMDCRTLSFIQCDLSCGSKNSQTNTQSSKILLWVIWVVWKMQFLISKMEIFCIILSNFDIISELFIFLFYVLFSHDD